MSADDAISDCGQVIRSQASWDVMYACCVPDMHISMFLANLCGVVCIPLASYGI